MLDSVHDAAASARAEGWRVQPRVKNGPALAGYAAETMRAAIAAQMTTMPEQLRRSLTWDRGKELAQHAQLRIDTGIAVSPTPTALGNARPTRTPAGCCASTKGTDLLRWSAEDIQAVAAALNSRPRETLGYKTPAEALNEYLLELTPAAS